MNCAVGHSLPVPIHHDMTNLMCIIFLLSLWWDFLSQGPTSWIFF